MTATWQYGKTAPAYSVGDVVEWRGRFYKCLKNIKAVSDGGGSNSPGYSGFWDQVVSEDDPRPLTLSEAQALTARLDPTSLAARDLKNPKPVPFGQTEPDAWRVGWSDHARYFEGEDAEDRARFSDDAADGAPVRPVWFGDAA